MAHRWDPKQKLWWGWDSIRKCTKCGKEYYEELDIREHPEIEYFDREDLGEVYMGREEFLIYLAQKEKSI